MTRSSRRATSRVASDELRRRFRDLHTVASELRDATQSYQQLRARGAFPSGRDVGFRADDPNHPLNRTVDITENAEFLVAVTGAFSSGKSTLLNLLLEQDTLLPASVIPMTAVCTVIRHGEQPACTVRYASFEECFARVPATIDEPLRRPFTGPEHLAAAATDPASFVTGAAAQASLVRFARFLERYDEIVAMPTTFDGRAPFISGGGLLRDPDTGAARYFPPTPAQEAAYRDAGGDPGLWVTREWLALIREVELRVQSPLLQERAVLLDLPGLNCKEDYHRRAIREFCNMADCIVVTAFQPGNQADAEALANFRQLTSAYRDKTFFVFNKVDQFADEPTELVHAVDYLSNDTIGADFAEDRFFLASAALGRGHRQGDSEAADKARRLGERLHAAVPRLQSLPPWVAPLAAPVATGGVGHLRDRLRTFLETDAFPGKIDEVLRHLETGVRSLVDAAEPTYGKYRDIDPADMQRQAVLEAHRELRDRLIAGVQVFRHGYLQADSTGAGLRRDLHRILDRTHGDVQRAIAGHFDRPILQAPLREDPVAEFDFLLIADRAADQLRRQVQDHVIEAVDAHVRKQLRERAFAGGGIRADLVGLCEGLPEQRERFDALVERFEATLRHSTQGIVRHGFFRMPRGRELRRLERRVPASQVKDLLVSVFREFYPGWIYENIYTRLLDELWLHLFLDAEEFERDLARYFDAAESALSNHNAAQRARLPQLESAGGAVQARSRWAELRGTVELCRRIDRIEGDVGRLQRGEPLAAAGRGAEEGAA